MKKSVQSLSCGILFLLCISSCSYITGIPDSESGPMVTRITTTGTFAYEIDTGSTARDVYFIFSTSAGQTNLSSPTVQKLSVDGTELPLPAKPLFPASFGSTATGYEKIAEANRTVAELLKQSSIASVRQLSIPAPRFNDTVGGTETFYDTTINSPYTVPATCQYVFTESSATAPDGIPRSLSIFVSNDQFTPTGPINQPMVDALAEHFLKGGPNNDIYDWLTAIMGSEWGSSMYSDLIGHTGNITILLTDIENDHSTDGGIVGYFYALNNFKNNSLPSNMQYSNERVMFTIDAPMYANGGASWSADDDWPKIVFSTLAHEFQHMIHFYQKQIIQQAPGSTEAWIDEMCAQVAEDLLADKMQVEGPRGVTYSDGTAGTSGNTNGRIPYYNRYTYLPLISDDSAWQSSDAVLYYSTVYAFGAWAARNYGGPEFLRNVVQCPYTDKRAVEYAAARGGAKTADMDSLIGRWAVSVIGSPRTDMPQGYMLNKDSWFSYSIGSLNYRLGSINFFNYRYQDQSFTLDGPRCIEPGQNLPAQNSTNTYYIAARAMTGKRQFKLTVPDGIIMHVLVN